MKQLSDLTLAFAMVLAEHYGIEPQPARGSTGLILRRDDWPHRSRLYIRDSRRAGKIAVGMSICVKWESSTSEHLKFFYPDPADPTSVETVIAFIDKSLADQ